MIMETIKLIKMENLSLYYEVRLFPNYERRIVSYSQEDLDQCSEEELLSWPAYDVALKLLQSGLFDKLNVCSDGAKLLPKSTSE